VALRHARPDKLVATVSGKPPDGDIGEITHKNFDAELLIRRREHWILRMAKRLRTIAQLSDAIMLEIRKHPQCSNIERVAIFRSLRPSRPDPTWTFAWIRRGKGPVSALALEIARQMQSEFDLA